MRWNKELQHTRITRQNLTPDCGSLLVPELYNDWIFEPKEKGINLIATSLISDSIVDTSNLGQNHSLVSIGINTEVNVDMSNLGQYHSLVSIGINTEVTNGVPTIGQNHSLVSIGINTEVTNGVPLFEIVPEVITLLANGIVSDSELDSPLFEQLHILNANSIETQVINDVPVFNQIYLFDTNGLILKVEVDKAYKIATNKLAILKFSDKIPNLVIESKIQHFEFLSFIPATSIIDFNNKIKTNDFILKIKPISKINKLTIEAEK
jgi:hypothetical protein